MSFEVLEIRPYCLINKLIPTKRLTLWVKNLSLNQILDCGHRTRILYLPFFICNRVLICTWSLLGKYISKKMSQLDIYNIPYKAIIGVKFNELLITCSSFITFVFEVIEDLLHEFFLFVWLSFIMLFNFFIRNTWKYTQIFVLRIINWVHFYTFLQSHLDIAL